MYIKPFTTSRMITVRLPPPVLPGGISGSTSPHASAVKSLGYRNLLRSQRARFSLVHIGDPSSNQATTLESQVIHMIQELFGQKLREMQQGGSRLYLATSKREAFARRILEHLELAAYFDGIHGSVPGGELDHKPELLAHILSKHSLLPSHSLMVGDRRYDISGAHAVGMRGLGVLWGYGTRDELETAGADQLVESTADLARTVLSMVSGKQSAG